MNPPKGFRYAATYAGIRKTAEDDVALIVSDGPAAAAAVFTKNRVAAAPVKVAQKNLRSARGWARALLANAGNANCATKTGERVALACVEAAARAIGCEAEQVLPASTGVIGVEMDGRLIVDALPKLIAGLDGSRFEDAARAIMTTDTRAKTALARVRGAVLAGMTKGSGMIQPRMATTLGFVMTDAAVAPGVLNACLKRAVERSYNRISVDGDTSTNDMVAVLAKRRFGNPAGREDVRAGAGRGARIAGATDRARRRGRAEADHDRRQGRAVRRASGSGSRGRSPTRRW